MAAKAVERLAGAAEAGARMAEAEAVQAKAVQAKRAAEARAEGGTSLTESMVACDGRLYPARGCRGGVSEATGRRQASAPAPGGRR